jgi:germination protein YpeB
MSCSVCNEVYGKAMTAQMSLGVLPFSTQELEQTAGFISKVGDYACMLCRSTAGGAAYTDEQRKNLLSMSETAALMAQNLNQMQLDMNDGYLTMDELLQAQQNADAAEGGGEGATVGGGMRLIEQEFPEQPTLIYDGPFSEHLSDTSPKLIEDSAEIGEDNARRVAAAFLDVQEGRVGSSGRCDGTIPCWRLSANMDGEQVSVSVSVKGGQVLSVLGSRSPESSSLSAEEGVGAARRFLESRGYKNMAESYHMIRNNVITVNFAYEQDGVICYPDLIKVGVALDDGGLISFDAVGYVSAHYERELPAAAVSAEKARKLVSPDLSVLSEKLTIIPSAGEYELFCHEFKCEAADGRHFIIYVNAVTGVQEKILLLLEDESGTLTM